MLHINIRKEQRKVLEHYTTKQVHNAENAIYYNYNNGYVFTEGSKVTTISILGGQYSRYDFIFIYKAVRSGQAFGP